MSTRSLLSLAITLFASALGGHHLASQSLAQKAATKSDFKVVLTSEVKWEALNPLRGDKGPRAGTLWGNRTGAGPAGFLLKPVDGFKSPPHIHNIAYRGVVISGLIHNDDPGAATMWMPAVSFWTQPAGGVHITACKGTCLAYIEVEDRFGVLPAAKAFSSKERPINVDVTNLVWIDQPHVPATARGPKVAFLWGNPQDDRPSGTLVRLPAGFSASVRSHGSILRAVLIQGRAAHQVPGKSGAKTLVPGSYFSSRGKVAHQVSCAAGAPCILYVRMAGKFDVVSNTSR